MRQFVEFRENTKTAKIFDKYFGTHKFEIIPVYKSSRQKFIEAIKDLTPDEVKKVKEYVEFLRYRRTYK